MTAHMLGYHSIAMSSVIGDISTSALSRLRFVVIQVALHRRRSLVSLVAFPIIIVSLCCIM